MKGEIRVLESLPADVSDLAMDAERFYWLRGGAIVTRPLAGGEERTLAETGNHFEPVTITRDDVAFWSDASRLAITIVPKGGVERRQITVIAHRHDPRRTGANHADPLVGLDDAVLWSEHRDDDVVLFAFRTREPGALPIEIGRVAGARSVSIETAGNAFALLTRVSDGYRIDACEAIGAPLRMVYHVASDETEEALVSLKVGARHIFVLYSSSVLSTTPVALVAVPRTGGASRVVDPRACPGALAVLDDDPLYVSAKRCPGEFPEAQRLEAVRQHLEGGRTEVVYAMYGGSVSLLAVNDRTVLLTERIPLPVPQGSAPEYVKRMARLTLR